MCLERDRLSRVPSIHGAVPNLDAVARELIADLDEDNRDRASQPLKLGQGWTARDHNRVGRCQFCSHGLCAFGIAASHHANPAEEGETANIKQNTTNKGFFRGRR
jgi:hypothetical protein